MTQSRLFQTWYWETQAVIQPSLQTLRSTICLKTPPSQTQSQWLSLTPAAFLVKKVAQIVWASVQTSTNGSDTRARSSHDTNSEHSTTQNVNSSVTNVWIAEWPNLKFVTPSRVECCASGENFSSVFQGRCRSCTRGAPREHHCHRLRCWSWEMQHSQSLRCWSLKYCYEQCQCSFAVNIATSTGHYHPEFQALRR